MRAVGLHGLPRVLTHSFPAQLRFAGAADKPAEEAVCARQQQLGGRRRAHALGRCAHRQRHAPRSRRAGRLVSGAPARHGQSAIDITGVTLPGTPAVVAGTNGQVAWGFTNSDGDFADARWGKCTSTDYGVRRETIAVKGDDAVEVVYRDVGAGVVLDGEDYRRGRGQRRVPAGRMARDTTRGDKFRPAGSRERARHR